jgi:hypothetical protein
MRLRSSLIALILRSVTWLWTIAMTARTTVTQSLTSSFLRTV